MENFFGCKRPNTNWRLSVQICGESYCRTRRPEKSWNKFQLEQLYYVPAFATVGLPQYATAVVPEEPNRDFTGIKVVEYNTEDVIDVVEEEEEEPQPEEEMHMQFYGCSFMMFMVNEQPQLPYKKPALQLQYNAAVPQLEGSGSTLQSHAIVVTEDDEA